MKKGKENDWSQLEETVRDLQKQNGELNEKYKKACQEFDKAVNEIVSLKSSVSSYKGTVTRLKRDLEKSRELGIEGDKMYCEKSDECERLKKELSETLEKKNSFIESLQARVQELTVERSRLQDKVASVSKDNEELYAEIMEMRKPWWKKLF